MASKYQIENPKKPLKLWQRILIVVSLNLSFFVLVFVLIRSQGAQNKHPRSFNQGKESNFSNEERAARENAFQEQRRLQDEARQRKEDEMKEAARKEFYSKFPSEHEIRLWKSRIFDTGCSEKDLAKDYNAKPWLCYHILGIPITSSEDEIK